ncbi:CDP-alcohol phosphatidyltransferase family protein [Arthrobacter sp. KK5.5]|uniref:CDP-alcohol phosphatidyltransferase family protein n=1 Tax=Arthrobacter sp. KK5.5 TaxID=3373084 RepID=UPI003EE6A2C8
MRFIGAGQRDDVVYRELRTFWTVPNLITVGRFLLVPVFVWLVAVQDFGWATVILVVLGATDWVDGYLARRLNQVSTVGKWLDPLADRLALITVAATFVIAGIAPAWLVYAIVVPDIVLIANAMLLFGGSPNLPVSNLGKIRTALLLVGTPLLLLDRVDGIAAPALGVVATAVLAVGCLLHVIAAIGYLIAARRKANALRTGKKWSG